MFCFPRLWHINLLMDKEFSKQTSPLAINYERSNLTPAGCHENTLKVIFSIDEVIEINRPVFFASNRLTSLLIMFCSDIIDAYWLSECCNRWSTIHLIRYCSVNTVDTYYNEAMSLAVPLKNFFHREIIFALTVALSSTDCHALNEAQPHNLNHIASAIPCFWAHVLHA